LRFQRLAKTRGGVMDNLNVSHRLRNIQQMDQEVSDLWSMLDRLKAENARLRAELAARYSNTYCAYCGFTIAIDLDGALIADHISTCEKHPMQVLAKRIAELEAELNLRKRIMRVFPFCADHRDKMLDKDCRGCAVERLRAALKRYTYCRHSNLKDCPCTMEAKAVLQEVK
jgi:hypothetical protein